MSSGIIVAFIIGLVLIYVVGKIFVVPLKLIGKLFMNAIIGGILLWVIDYFGSYIGMRIPINPITALIAGVLGVPGIVLLIVLHYLMIK